MVLDCTTLPTPRVVVDLPQVRRNITRMAVDDLGVALGWSEAMTRAGRSLDVLVKVDVGFHRCGVAS